MQFSTSPSTNEYNIRNTTRYSKSHSKDYFICDFYSFIMFLLFIRVIKLWLGANDDNLVGLLFELSHDI